MEIEKTLFRIREKMLFDTCTQKLTHFFVFFFSLASFYQLAVLLLANSIYSSRSYCPVELQPQTIHTIQVENAELTLLASKNIEFLTL